MADTETGPGPTADELAERAEGKAALQLAELQAGYDKMAKLVEEHAAAMGRLYDEHEKDIAETGELVGQLRRAHTELRGDFDALKARVDDALVRLGVEQKGQQLAEDAKKKPPAPPSDMVFDGVGWVPKPKAATDEGEQS